MNLLNERVKNMFCPNCGKELAEDVTVCEYCGNDLTVMEIEETSSKKDSNSLKDFILYAGRTLVDFDTACGIGLAILVIIIFWIAILGAFLPDENGYFESIKYTPIWFIMSIILSIIILIWVVISKYIIYLLIDIRDSLAAIKSQNKENKDEIMS